MSADEEVWETGRWVPADEFEPCPPRSCPECCAPFCGRQIPAMLCDPCERAGFTIATRMRTEPVRRPVPPAPAVREA